MRKRVIYLMAACLGAGSLGVGTGLQAADVDVNVKAGTTQPAGKITLPQGITQKDLKEGEDIRHGLARYTNDALKPDGFRDAVSQFQDADEERMEKFAGQHKADLNNELRTFLGAWKAKYGSGFDANQDKLLTMIWPDANVTIVQGEISDPKMLSNWPVNPAEGVTIHKTPPGDEGEKALDKGRNVALVSLPAEHNLPALNVSMISQIGGWVIDVPDTLTAEQYHANLKQSLAMMSQNLKDFPANINDGYRLASHYLLMAAYNVPFQKDGQRIEGK